MPIYEYECADCGKRFERLQRNGENPDLTCPSCSSTSAQKVLSAGSFIFKGSGFYATDYKKKEQKPAAECSSCCAESKSCPAAKKAG